MNNYDFDYFNYLNGIPNNMNYTNMKPITPSMMPNTPLVKNNQILSPTEGFIKGNIFKNLYEPYKSYKPGDINPKNEREALLYQIMQYKFSLIDLNLYLDNYPNDKELIDTYNKYLNIEKQMCDQYESKYGPLTLDSNYLNKNTWVWEKSPWPWEVM